jgi:hypothetical protein
LAVPRRGYCLEIPGHFPLPSFILSTTIEVKNCDFI